MVWISVCMHAYSMIFRKVCRRCTVRGRLNCELLTITSFGYPLNIFPAATWRVGGPQTAHLGPQTANTQKFGNFVMGNIRCYHEFTQTLDGDSFGIWGNNPNTSKKSTVSMRWRGRGGGKIFNFVYKGCQILNRITSIILGNPLLICQRL